MFKFGKCPKKILENIFEVLTPNKFKRFEGNPNIVTRWDKTCLSSKYYQKDIIIRFVIMKTSKKQAKPKKFSRKVEESDEPFES